MAVEEFRARAQAAGKQSLPQIAPAEAAEAGGWPGPLSRFSVALGTVTVQRDSEGEGDPVLPTRCFL